jgi:ribonucleoside-diphosphate reductase beta chain
MIHSESYSYALSQILGERATGFLNATLNDPVVRNRMNSEIDAFQAVESIRHDMGIDKDSDFVKKAVLKMLVSIYLLEGIKFPFSFFVTYIINKAYNSPIQGVTKLLKLINHDEFSFHLPTNARVIKVLSSDASQGYKHLFDSGWFAKMVLGLATFIEEQELDWNLYLLRDGGVQGYNQTIGEHFIKYFACKRIKELGVQPLQEVKANDTVKWFNTYRDINKGNAAAQETTSISYQKGGLTNDIEDYFQRKASA